MHTTTAPLTVDKMINVVVVGAGLSGLTAAFLLHEQGFRVRVLERQNRIGGRIDALYDSKGRYLADFGPSWVWPPYQPLAAQWIERLGVTLEPQFDKGDAIADLSESESGRRQFLPGQDGISRIKGGPSALIDALSAHLPEAAIETGISVSGLAQERDGLQIIANTGKFQAEYAVLAVPPRIARQTFAFTPDLKADVSSAMDAAPTWMAPQAKAVLVYEKPFWRDQGMSGRVASRIGPLIEIHDMGDSDDDRGILFGFLGVPHELRAQHADAMRAAIIAQMQRCFGAEGENPLTLEIKDWATDPAIAARLDLTMPPAHPEILPEIIRAPLYDGRLHFAGAETATRSPGLIEGAFDAGTRAANQIIAARDRTSA